MSDFKITLLPELRRESSEKGKVWAVRVIRSGRSLNGLVYPPEVLQEAVDLFDGVPVFSYEFGGQEDHLPDEARKQRPSGFAGNAVGRITRPYWNKDAEAIDAYLEVFDDTTRDRMVAAYDAGAIGGGKDVFGLSIDAEGVREGDTVTRLVSATSVDFVTFPAAGGKIRRLVASLQLAESGGATLEEQLGAMPEALFRGLMDRPSMILSACADGVCAVKESCCGACASGKPCEAKTGLPARVECSAAEDPHMSNTPTKPKKTRLQEADAEMVLAGIQELLAQVEPQDLEAVCAAVRSYLDELEANAMSTPEQTPPPAPAMESTPKAQPVPVMASATPATPEVSAELKESLQAAAAVATGEAKDHLDRVLASISGEEPKDPRDVRIAALENRLRESAIQAELDKHVGELKIIDADAAVRLLDPRKYSVSDDFSKVEGLREALQELVNEKPWLVNKKPAKAKTSRVREGLGQNVPLRESADAGTPAQILDRRQRNIIARSAGGDIDALAKMRRMRLNGELHATAS